MLDLSNTTAPLMSLGANTTLALRGLRLQGVMLALPTPPSRQLQPAQLLQLRAIQLRAPGAMLVLRDVAISTPSCGELSLHQALLCGSAPSPHFIVTPGFLWLSHWSTSALEARNVTVTCSGPVEPHPCVSVVATSGQDVVNALALLQTPSYPLAVMYIYIANDITLAGTAVPVCGRAVEAAGSSIPAAACTRVALGANASTAGGSQGCAVPIRSPIRQAIPVTLSRMVITGGSMLPPQLASALGGGAGGASGADAVAKSVGSGSNGGMEQPAVLLDTGGVAALIDIRSGTIGRLEIYNLTLTGLSLGLPQRYPLGFLRGLLA
ncbi:hypothetical protein GPECTOR_9g672 [Gonium pectorale]|uniref:Uncharacterized protein n=1 Tax=Gonium pectorale TaxID=33097 RepID=A0A150GS10_GONPE|nr:hypothetical protein GPECTOR_9g672 [Gonium pectorale]|eukprot:KXZ52627.1 hypothetical protein GPECTOR_9g672 [Gonium pectorale]